MEVQDVLNSKEHIEPATIRALTSLSDEDVEATLVLDVIKNSNAIFEDMYVFENAVLVLNGLIPDVTKVEGSTPQLIWKAIDMIKKLRPSMEYSHEVLMYIKYIFNDFGMWFYPVDIGLDNPIFKEVKERALNGPFPLEEDRIGIQAYRYLANIPN